MCIVFSIFCLPFLVIYRLTTPKGLPVRLLRPGVEGSQLPGLDPLLIQVRLARKPGPALLFVESQPVAWEQLGGLLNKELPRRPPNWPVYVQGDADLEWRQVAQVVDIVRGKWGQVVLLTDPGRRLPSGRETRPGPPTTSK